MGESHVMETPEQMKVTTASWVARLPKLGRCLTEGHLADLGTIEKVTGVHECQGSAHSESKRGRPSRNRQ